MSSSHSIQHQFDMARSYQEHAQNVIEAIKEDGERVVSRITTISYEGRAPKNDPAIFALALAASCGNDKTRAAAFDALPASPPQSFRPA